METVNIQEQIHAKQALTLRDIYIYQSQKPVRGHSLSQLWGHSLPTLETVD